MDAVFDPLFHLPFATGLLLAVILPLIGAALMLRDEWLAALGLAHLAAAGAALGLAVGVTAIAGGLLAALGGGAVKGLLGVRGNTAYAFMILGGWSVLLLTAANSAIGDALGHALIEGQLYFAGPLDLTATIGAAILAAIALPWLLPRLLRARLFPHHETANRLPAWRWHLGFDLLSAATIAVATATLGLMGAFALVLVPAWCAFRIAAGWRWALFLAALIGTVAYLAAFAGALVLDQPFGPVLVAVLLGVAAAISLPAREWAAAPGVPPASTRKERFANTSNSRW